MKKLLILVILATLPASAFAQQERAGERVIRFPDVPGFRTLKVDLHLHSVFSDGKVWPDVRIGEAVRDGLDAVAITEHIEYQPHRDDIPHPNRNRAYEIAAASGSNSDVIVIHGSEITRGMPPGHSNAIFLEDSNALLVDDPMDAFREARRQNAFVFWNHPMWISQRSDGIATLTDMHRELIRDGMLHGIEVVNHHSYSEEALQIALEHDLTILGTSDIHGLIDWDYNVPHGHRPVTLVFARERSAEAIREALDQGRTAVWYENLLIGREENLRPLIEASVEITAAQYRGESSVLNVSVTNHSDAEYILQNRSGYTMDTHADVITLKPHATTNLLVRTLERLESVALEFEVLNAVTAPGVHARVSLRATVAN